MGFFPTCHGAHSMGTREGKKGSGTDGKKEKHLTTNRKRGTERARDRERERERERRDERERGREMCVFSSHLYHFN